MINFAEGKVDLDADNFLAVSKHQDLNDLSEKGLIERRESSGGRTYYYVETEEDGMKFGVFIRLRGKKIEWFLLRWLDRPMKGWDDVSEKAMTDEYQLLSDFVKNKVGSPPSNKKTGARTWRFEWGELEVSYEVRSFDVAIFMKPR